MRSGRKCMIAILLILAVCAGMSACTAPAENPGAEKAPDYTVIRENGQYYIVFGDPIVQGSNENYEQITAGLDFPSLKAFKDTVLNGSLTEREIKKIYLYGFGKTEDGRILTPDFDNLYSPVLPEGFTVRYVNWEGGENYCCSLASDKNLSGSVVFAAEQDYEDRFRDDYQNYFENPLMTVVDRQEAPDGKIITTYVTSLATIEIVQFSMSDENKTIHVFKKYRLESNNLPISADTPASVKLYCTEGGRQYWVTLRGFKEDPSDEWLFSFGSTEFAD